MKANNENLQVWEERIKDRVQNGLSIDEWCQKYEMSKHQYYYWNRRVRKVQKGDEETMFAEIAPVVEIKENESEKVIASSDFQIFFNGIQVTVPENFNSQALAGLMKILQKL